MADLDTRARRASSVQVLAPWLASPVLPDGAIGQGDRQHMAWSYSGILAGAPAATPTSGARDVFAAGARATVQSGGRGSFAASARDTFKADG